MQKMRWQHQRTRLLAALTLGLLTVSFAMVSVAVAQEGTEQSPIDIQSVVRIGDEHLALLHFSYQPDVSLSVVNTGSPDIEATVRANVPPGAGSVRVNGVLYNLLQFHWHTPSEHVLDSHEFPMEMHLVHQAADGTLLVVGVFLEEVAGQRHQELQKIFADLPTEEGEDKTVAPFNLRRLLPREHTSFRYRGSLTTPPFTEGVRWVVLAEPIIVSPGQVRAFQTLFPNGNGRELQPLNNRLVVTDQELNQ
jgi:carbonic anhydrase